LIARAVLQNRSSASGEAEITLHSTTRRKTKLRLVRRLTIALGVRRRSIFRFEFQNPGNAHWIWTARLNELSDAVESDLPVGFAARSCTRF
jgi:hypothetical protein